MIRNQFKKINIPEKILFVINELKKQKFEAYIVGGCVRDLLMNKEPEDWDVTTNAKPEKIQKIFLKSFYENRFGTVTVLIPKSENILQEKKDQIEKPEYMEIEITPFRLEAKYSDKRHPDEIKFAKTIEEDLARRDFTINAMAMKIQKSKIKNFTLLDNFISNGTGNENVKLKIIDLFGGREDLDKKIIRAVGEANDRFQEDALRMMRAVRFSAVFDFEIESKTKQAIKKNSLWIEAISKERIKDEFVKIIMSENPAKGIELLREVGLLKYIIPELEENYKVGQNKHHIYDCYEHALRSLQFSAEKKFNKFVRISALFHDIGKPRVKAGEGPNSTFYNHEVVGTKMTIQILNRLCFPKKDIEKIGKLVRYHLFYYNVDEVSESSIRRLVRQAGPENMEELIQVRISDRLGSGVPKAEPYKLRHLKYIIEKVSQDPISVGLLKVNGNDIMEILKISPGPKIGKILDILLGLILDDPEKNKKEFLEKEIVKLGELSEDQLTHLAQKAREERQKIETKRDEMTKKKYWVV